MSELGTRIRSLPGDTRVCLGFFSRLPTGISASAPDFSTSAAAWPLAGAAIIAGPAALLWFASLFNLPDLILAALAIGSAALVSGCLHEDGFADTFDGFGGGGSKQRKLDIMNDSRIGTYGTVALVFNLLLRVTALAAIIAAGNGIVALFAAAIVSRSLALWHWFTLPPARDEGLAATAGQPDEQALVIGSVLGFAALFGLLIFLGTQSVFAVFLAAVAVAVFTRVTQSQIGGHSGDTIGAAQQVAEIALLIGLAAGWGSSPL